MVMRPQVITTQNVLTSFISPAGDRIAAMIGTSQWGEINAVTSISNMSEFVNTFGDDIAGTSLTLPKGADLFFRNGGTLKVVRITDGTEVNSSLILMNCATQMITLTATHPGTYGDNISASVSAIDANKSLVITDGTTTENYTNNGAGYSTNTLITTAINASSTLVTAEVIAGQESTLVADVTSTQLSGGDNGAGSLSTADYTDAIDNLLWTVDYNFLLIPGNSLNAFQVTVAGKIDSRASSEKKYSRYITGITVDESIATATARTASSKRITVLSPSAVYTNRADDNDQTLDGSYLACAYAGVLCKSELEFSGTHQTVSVNGLLVNTTSGKEYYTKAEQEQLLEGGIAPVSLIGSNIQMVRGITKYGDSTSIWTDEVIVDIVDYVTEQCEGYLETVLGKPNTADNRAIYSARLDAILKTLINQKIIQEYLPSQVREGSSPDTILADINIKPTYSTNFVLLTLNIN